jgi:hypothetical protein
MVASWVSQASFEPLGLTIAVAKDRAIESMMQVRTCIVLPSEYAPYPAPASGRCRDATSPFHLHLYLYLSVAGRCCSAFWRLVYSFLLHRFVLRCAVSRCVSCCAVLCRTGRR